MTTIRLRTDGPLDSAYGGGDWETRTNVNPGVGGFEVANAIALRNDGSAVVAGSAAPAGTFLFALAAYRKLVEGSRFLTPAAVARLPQAARGHSPAMAVRIAVGLFAALRAVLIYGEAARLATQPIHPPRLWRPARSGPVAARAARGSA